MFEKLQKQLQAEGLSLDDIVRSRHFGGDRESRDIGGRRGEPARIVENLGVNLGGLSGP
jgi:hypothetical protein